MKESQKPAIYHIPEVYLFFLLFIFASCQAHTIETSEAIEPEIEIDDSLGIRIRDFINKKNPKGILGFYLYDLTADKPVYEKNIDSLMIPASCTKLLTGITAINLLGDAYKFETKLHTSGSFLRDTLYGNILLNIGPDPLLNNDCLHLFITNAQCLKFKVIKGHLEVFHPDYRKFVLLQNPNIFDENVLLHNRTMLKQYLRKWIAEKGIKIPSDSIIYVDTITPSKASDHITHSLESILKAMLKESNNTIAECLLFHLGQINNKQPKNAQTAGIQKILHFIENNINIKNSHYKIKDGSGLSYENRMSPRFLISLLKYAYSHPSVYTTLQKSLPISGTDGTLKGRMKGQISSHRIHAKTGTLFQKGGISTLTGYCTGRNGHDLAFCIMLQNIPIITAQAFQDELCNEMVK